MCIVFYSLLRSVVWNGKFHLFANPLFSLQFQNYAKKMQFREINWNHISQCIKMLKSKIEDINVSFIRTTVVYDSGIWLRALLKIITGDSSRILKAYITSNGFNINSVSQGIILVKHRIFAVIEEKRISCYIVHNIT